jgi:hypothetical protein
MSAEGDTSSKSDKQQDTTDGDDGYPKRPRSLSSKQSYQESDG